MRGRGALGARAATGTSTRRRPTATRRASGGRCATAAYPARRCSSRPSSTRRTATRWRRSAQPRAARRRPVDLYIIHWPQSGPTWAWDGMQRPANTGYARSIGVSNFGAQRARAGARGRGRRRRSINQVQFSPFEFRRALLDGCERARRGTGGLQPARAPAGISTTRSTGIAERLGRTPAQVLLRWCDSARR